MTPTKAGGPGPSRDYDREWPSEREELREYATMRLDPARFLDENLRKRYAKFLQAWNPDDGAVSARKIRRLNHRQRKKQRLGEFEGN